MGIQLSGIVMERNMFSRRYRIGRIGLVGLGILGAGLVGGLSFGLGGHSSSPRLEHALQLQSGPTDTTLPQSGKSDSQIAAAYLRGFVTGVTHVAVKRTTWGAYLPYSGLTQLPYKDNSNDVIDVVVQAGTVHNSGWGGYANGNGHTYSYVVSTVDVSNPQGLQTVLAVPDSAWPSWLTRLSGPETDATPAKP